MVRFRFVLTVAVLVLTLGLAAAQEATLATASGTVAKVEKDVLTIRPRGPDGKFDKELKLKLTGTSKLTMLTSQKRAGKVVVVQTNIEAKDLAAKQGIAVIYSMGPAGAVLLTAVAQPVPDK